MNPEEHIANIGKAVRSEKSAFHMEPQDKAALRGALESHMAANPLPVRNHTAHTSPMVEPISRARLTNKRNNPIMIIGTIIALLLSGSVSLAAETALPGDLLYPVKIHVNEEVRAAVSVSAEAEAAWEARRAERRLEEAERLQARARLDAEAKAQIATQFEEHSKSFAEKDATVTAEGKTEVSAELKTDFETKLRSHESALIQIIGDAKVEEHMDAGADVKGEVNAIIDATIKGTVDANVGATLPINIKVDAEGKPEAKTETQTNVKVETKTDTGIKVVEIDPVLPPIKVVPPVEVKANTTGSGAIKIGL
jgi:hypothetical protein